MTAEGDPDADHPRRHRGDPYAAERARRRRRRRQREDDSFDPAPPIDADYTVPAQDRLRRVAAPEPLEELLGDVLEERGWGERLKGGRLAGRWEQVVGVELAGRCEPVRLAGGILLVRARSQAWATEIGYLTTQIRERANALLDDDLVREVQLTIGELDEDR